MAYYISLITLLVYICICLQLYTSGGNTKFLSLHLASRAFARGVYERRNTTPIAPRTKTYVDDTNKTTQDDKYPWLDADDRRQNMTDRLTFVWKFNLKDSRFKIEQRVKIYDFIDEHCDLFSL